MEYKINRYSHLASRSRDAVNAYFFSKTCELDSAVTRCESDVLIPSKQTAIDQHLIPPVSVTARCCFVGLENVCV